MTKNEISLFDKKLAEECIDAFCASTLLSGSIDDFSGNTLYRRGKGCESCRICAIYEKARHISVKCGDTHLYGMLQAQRFGGKYIYFCPCGFTFIVSPIMGEGGAVAYAKVGPFLMVEPEDYIRYDLADLLKLSDSELANARILINDIPFVAPERVTKLSTLLYMSVGFMNNAEASASQKKTQASDDIQGNINEILKALKAQTDDVDKGYPFEKENELIASIVDGDKDTANRLLNDLLGYIFFYSGGEFEIIRARVFELLVLISRAAVDGGADETHIFSLNTSYFEEIKHIKSLDGLCLWLVEIMNRLTDYVFRFTDVKHVDVIRKAVDYIRRNYQKKITLEDVASYVFLSPSYFSKIFKEEMEQNFNAYLNKIRIDKAKQLLLNDSVRLIDVAGLVGYEDQSYFSKVFKKLTNQTPGRYREVGNKK